MRQWSAQRIADAAGATLLQGLRRSSATGPGPAAVSIDSRALRPAELFVGLAGTNADGGRYAAQALSRGAWGALIAPEHAHTLADEDGVVLTHDDPLRGLQSLARAWLKELRSTGARVVAITGSTGKTSTKDILAALLATDLRTSSSPENFNTEIGLALAILAAGADTQALVLEMAMRGPGQIAELAAIAEPDVAVITNIGPVHLQLLGSIEAIAAAKAELIAGLQPGATAIIPAAEPLLEPHLRADIQTVTFGSGGEVTLLGKQADGTVRIAAAGQQITLRPSFSQSHNLHNLLAAVAAARVLGLTPTGDLQVNFSALRGQRVRLQHGIVLINDCYNANPISMRAALEDLAASAPARRVAVLGDMLELGERAVDFHRQLAEQANRNGVELLVTVGELAGEMAELFSGEVHRVEDAVTAAGLLGGGLLREGDTVLVKGSRGVGLERIAERLGHGVPQAGVGSPGDGERG